MPQTDFTKAMNSAVTNTPEQVVFSFLLVVNVIFLIMLGINFVNIAKWSIINKACACKLYCINANLYLVTILRIISFAYPLVGFYLESRGGGRQTTHKIYQNTSLYQYICHLTMIQLNMTLLIVSKSWLQILKIKYQDRTTMLTKIEKILTFIIFFSFIVAFISVTLTFIKNDGYQYIQATWIVIIICCIVTDTLFCFSSLVLYFNVKDMEGITNQHKIILRYASVILIVASLNRFAYIILRLLNTDVLENLKNYDKTTRVDSGPKWALLELEFFFVTDFIPSLIIAILFKPNINPKADQLSQLNSLISRKTYCSSTTLPDLNET